MPTQISQACGVVQIVSFIVFPPGGRFGLCYRA
ncbi:hypothetical protein SAMN06265338_101706 [Rhodoblastus acidophilus]|uniref:Uncharacterized protein n=1 Tax=Rhodoblastus acidophilus TaxID=1074 RepID=A0A212QL50_RHOAC|nr:hypothetical protein [Rhodoblastus acidophilus]SNB59958.1 hypothetical protein SAMN06265338_101706 [Rhodoblastus acidophilus]